MHWPRFRPRFTLDLAVPGAAFLGAVRTVSARGERRVLARIIDDAVELHLPIDEQRVFTPVLHVRVDDAARLVRARFAPHPHVWTGVMALYFLLAMAAVAGLVFAACQLILGGTLLTALALPAALVAGGVIHGAVIFGQGLAAEQMHVLRRVVEDALVDAQASLDRQG